MLTSSQLRSATLFLYSFRVGPKSGLTVEQTTPVWTAGISFVFSFSLRSPQSRQSPCGKAAFCQLLFVFLLFEVLAFNSPSFCSSLLGYRLLLNLFLSEGQGSPALSPHCRLLPCQLYSEADGCLEKSTDFLSMVCSLMEKDCKSLQGEAQHVALGTMQAAAAATWDVGCLVPGDTVLVGSCANVQVASGQCPMCSNSRCTN